MVLCAFTITSYFYHKSGSRVVSSIVHSFYNFTEHLKHLFRTSKVKEPGWGFHLGWGWGGGGFHRGGRGYELLTQRILPAAQIINSE